MNETLGLAIEAWESEGGFAGTAPPDTGMTGTINQVDWATRIRHQVRAEFDRVSTSFRSIAKRQTGDRRGDTLAIIAILEEKRDQVLSRRDAGYFICDWWETGDRVRQLIFDDPRYQAIKNSRRARPRNGVAAPSGLELKT